MTNCYICGHPILEGQKVRVEDFVTNEGQAAGLNDEQIIHANPADHLPTLRSDRGRDPDDYQYELAVAKHERERAARMVEEFIAENPYMENVQAALAKRIRNGDE